MGQLPAAQLALGDQFEPGPLKVVDFEAPLGYRSLIEQPLEDPPGYICTTPSYSPMPMPNSTAARSSLQRTSGVNRFISHQLGLAG
jgi:hypothetical protein